jgi:hypothetical protein
MQVCSFVTQMTIINISSISKHNFKCICAVNNSWVFFKANCSLRRTSVQIRDSHWHQNMYRQTTNSVLMYLVHAEIKATRSHMQREMYLSWHLYMNCTQFHFVDCFVSFHDNPCFPSSPTCRKVQNSKVFFRGLNRMWHHVQFETRARAHYSQRNTWGVRGVRGCIKRVEDYTAGEGETCFSRQFVQKDINHTYGDSSDAASSYACMKDTSLTL